METAPVFIVGAGRSGTTLLYKLISLHPEVSFISQFDRSLPAWLPSQFAGRFLRPFPSLKRIFWFKDEGNAYFIDRPLVKKIIPSPVEAERIYTECGLSVYPDEEVKDLEQTKKCMMARFTRMQRHGGGRVIVSKRTSNNQRIRLLNSIFPQAKFVNVVRDGRAVAFSLGQVEWWHQHKLWWAEKTPGELEQQGFSALEVCARNWIEDIEAIKTGLQDIDNNRVIDITYERLMDDPEMELARILEFIGLNCKSSFEAAWRSLNLKPREDKWRVNWSVEEREIVEGIQNKNLAELGYI